MRQGISGGTGKNPPASYDQLPGGPGREVGPSGGQLTEAQVRKKGSLPPEERVAPTTLPYLPARRAPPDRPRNGNGGGPVLDPPPVPEVREVKMFCQLDRQ